MLLEKKRSYFTTDDIEIYSKDSDDSDSDEKTEKKEMYKFIFKKKQE